MKIEERIRFRHATFEETFGESSFRACLRRDVRNVFVSGFLLTGGHRERLRLGLAHGGTRRNWPFRFDDYEEARGHDRFEFMRGNKRKEFGLDFPTRIIGSEYVSGVKPTGKHGEQVCFGLAHGED